MILYRSKANIIGAFVVSVICGILLFLLHDMPDARYYMAGIGVVAGIVWGWVMSIEAGSTLRMLRYVDLFAGFMSALNLSMHLLHPVASGWGMYLLSYPGAALITAYFFTISLLGFLAKK